MKSKIFSLLLDEWFESKLSHLMQCFVGKELQKGIDDLLEIRIKYQIDFEEEQGEIEENGIN